MRSCIDNSSNLSVMVVSPDFWVCKEPKNQSRPVHSQQNRAAYVVNSTKPCTAHISVGVSLLEMFPHLQEVLRFLVLGHIRAFFLG